MKKVMIVVSFLALTAILVGTLAFVRGDLAEATNNHVMLWASLVWFVATPCWMQRKKR